MMKRQIITTALLAGSLGLACNRSPSRPLELRAPSQIKQAATSTNQSLCESLNVFFTFRQSNGAVEPVYDDEAATPSSGQVCVWEIPPKTGIPVGTYDMIVRFETKAANAPCNGNEPVVAGAYVILDVNFIAGDDPFDDTFPGFIDALFFSGPRDDLTAIPIPAGSTREQVTARYEQALESLGLALDLDNDQIGNLTEIGLGWDVCEVTLPPTIALTVEDPATEAEAMAVRVEVDLGGTPMANGAGFELAIRHANDISSLGWYRTYEISVSSTVEAPADVSVNPAPGSTGLERELWDLEVTSDSSGWNITFTPDEPFVGDLTFVGSVTDGEGNVLALEATTVARAVGEVEDPVRLLFTTEEDPTPAQFIATSTIGFAEINQGARHTSPPYCSYDNSSATTQRFIFEDDDIPATPADHPNAWEPEPTASFTAAGIHLEMGSGAGHWILRWSDPNHLPGTEDDKLGPSNLEATAYPTGWPIEIELVAGADVVAIANVTVIVSPSLNQAPLIENLDPQDLVLPKGSFAEHVIHFHVVDPDRVATPPSCVFEITGSTSCSQPFAEPIPCTPTGPQQDGVWPFAIVLTAVADYATACGAEPEFGASLAITDIPPPMAANGAATTSEWCLSYSDDFCGDQQDEPIENKSCGSPLGVITLSTAGIVSAAVPSGGSATLPASYVAPAPGLVHGPTRKAIVGIEDSTDDEQSWTYLLSLDDPSVAFSHRFARDELCEMNDGEPVQEQGAVYEGGTPEEGRILAIGSRTDSPAEPCGLSTEFGVMLVEDLTNATPTVTSWYGSTFCDPGNPPYAVVDADGNFWLTCKYEDTLNRIDTAGSLSSESITTLNPTGLMWWAGDTLRDQTGKNWLIFPDLDGLLLVDLDSFDGIEGGLVTQRIDTTTTAQPLPSFGFSDLAGHVVDRVRHDYVFMMPNGVSAGSSREEIDLYRLRFNPAPFLEDPLSLSAVHQTNTGTPSRLILREPAGEAASEADLVFAMNTDSPVPFVDLDRDFADYVTAPPSRPASDFDRYGHGLHRSPDRRYCIYIVRDDPVELYTWDPDGAVVETDVDAIKGYSGGDSVTVSDAGHLILIADENTDAPLQVLYFPESEAGQD